jgi:ABC-type phosphate/phosphonate transport system permease subunit
MTTFIRIALMTTLMSLSATATWLVAQNRFGTPKTIIHVSVIQWKDGVSAADKKQVEGIRASGGNALHEIRFGLMPQVLPVIAGQVLYFIESNTRSATIIGIVGAGGIGLQLAEQIRVLEWQKVSFLILMILVAVAAWFPADRAAKLNLQTALSFR